MFLAAGEYMALTGQPMFEEPVEAWDCGPVVHTVYVAYKNTEGRESIKAARKGDPAKLNGVARSCVESVVLRFGSVTGPELIRFTHDTDPRADTYRPGSYRTPIDQSGHLRLLRPAANDRTGGRSGVRMERLPRWSVRGAAGSSRQFRSDQPPIP